MHHHFIVVLLASLGALYVGARHCFLHRSHKVFQRISLFLWNKFAVPAMRSVQAVIKRTMLPRLNKPKQSLNLSNSSSEVAKQEPDWDYLEIRLTFVRARNLFGNNCR